MRAPLLVGGLLGAAALRVAVVDPHAPGSYGICPSVWLGFYCPGCGALRASYDLLHGDLAAAWAMNPLWVVAAPLVVLLWLGWAAARWQGSTVPAVPRWLGGLLIALFVLFGLLRNVPALRAVLGPV